ncbi:GNAT family N-acetyltransferase [Nonomuraea sp. NPDC050310]|uniref:GNAT family N-acetyltransferase n=1 Tax=Nonomuraea sp. NPDC050310 TaxID=3154935 RepID=UPI0033D2FC9F
MDTALNAPIRRALPEDAAAVAELIATAFMDLPQSAVLVPERDQRHQVLTAQFSIVVEHALTPDGGGAIHVISRPASAQGEPVIPAAAAVWFDNTADPPPPPPPDYDARLKAATGAWHDRFLHLDRVLTEHHPSEPHHFLLFLAVHPELQGRGLGGRLLDHCHRAHLGHAAAYLDAASPASRDLYARHGYEALPPYELTQGVRFWPMWRPAAPLTYADDERR